ncbi:hypothetical protein HKD37_04G009998 [Glycine soja]
MRRIFIGLHPADVCRQFHHPPPFSPVPSHLQNALSNQNFPVITKGFCISIDTLYLLWFMLLCCISCFLLIILRFIGGLTRRISTNPCLFLLYQLNIFRFTFAFVNYIVIYKTKVERKDIELVDEEEAQIGADRSSETSNKAEIYNEEAPKKTQKHKPKRVESVNADAEALGDSAKVVIKQDMKGRKHKYGFKTINVTRQRRKGWWMMKLATNISWMKS